MTHVSTRVDNASTSAVEPLISRIDVIRVTPEQSHGNTTLVIRVTPERSHGNTTPVIRVTPGRRHGNTTVVTAFFHLDAFRKGDKGRVTPDMYREWFRKFKYILNPLIVYTDSSEFAQLVKVIRDNASNTVVVEVNRNSFWAFAHYQKISELYSQNDYPKHYPNTVIPGYACVQMAKYDALERAREQNFFSTEYYMWLDVGYFRDRTSTNYFFLSKPYGFNDSLVAINLVSAKSSMDIPITTIFHRNLVWVGGGLVFMHRELVLPFTRQFREAASYVLSRNLMNTDQQIVYAMYSREGRAALHPRIELVLHRPPTDNQWFHLGYSLMHEVPSS